MSKEHPHEAPPSYDESLGHQPAGFVDPSTNQGPPYPQHSSGMPPYTPQTTDNNLPYPRQDMPQPSPMPIYPTSRQHQSRTNVVVLQPGVPTVVVHEILPRYPTAVTCPSCRQNVPTRVIYKAGSRTHLWGIFLCLFGCWPCVPIPYCMDSCKNATHFCSNCGSYVGLGL